jgi:hypothetical protein
MDQSWAVLSNCVLQGMVPFISVLKLCLVDSSAMQSGVCVLLVCVLPMLKQDVNLPSLYLMCKVRLVLCLSYLDFLLVLPGCVSDWLMIFGCDD